MVVFQPLKHYHVKAVDIVVREGCTNITKLEFLGFIQEVRRQAFKTETILSAFKKTGIHPFNPQVILDRISKRAVTPELAPYAGSSPFGTPLTIRKLNRVANRLKDAAEASLELGEPLSEEAVEGIYRFTRGALVQGTELLQTRQDLCRTELATAARKARRVEKNRHLQTGGRLTVADGRNMVKKIEENELQKAQAIIEAHLERQRKG